MVTNDEYYYAFLDENNFVKNLLYFQEPLPVELRHMFLESQAAESVVLQTEETGKAVIGGDFFEGIFRIPEPEDSLGWDEMLLTWIVPIEPSPTELP